MVAALEPLAPLFRLNTRLFSNVLDGLTDADARIRPNGVANNVAFVAGHLVESRAWMARYLGGDEPAPFGGALEHAVTIEQIPMLPTLAAIGEAWGGISDRMDRRLDGLSDADLAGVSSQKFPGVPLTVLGGLGFLLQHESYHIGQLALLRKFLGHGPMSYR